MMLSHMFQNICGFSNHLVTNILVIRPILELNADRPDHCYCVCAHINSNEHNVWYKPVAFTMVSRSQAQTPYIGYSDSRLVGAFIIGIRLIGAHITGTRLIGACFIGIRQIGARVTGTRVIGARISGTRLIGAYFIGTRLIGARIIGTRLIGARITGTRLIGARITGTRLIDACIMYVLLVPG